MAGDLEAKALAWIEAHPVFERSYTAPLEPASEHCPELYNCITDPLSVGIRFKRPVQAGDSAADLQELLDFVSMERVEVPDLEVPAGWSVSAMPPCSSFHPGEEDQAVRIESFDGKILHWTIESKTFFALSGNDVAVLEEMRMCCGRPMPEGSYFQARKDFRGVLHFESALELSSAAPPAPPAPPL
mmetsp:Transcript_10711/g.21737  ORF Transcript_10711/g.21737 Transcript_10711/m.21737 type:complete len:186 (-) Transcript_10711:91-648(-)